MSDRREQILGRIRRLRERTTKRGCTEAEALSAAAKVAELMQQYGLAEGDIDISQEEAETRAAVRSQRSNLTAFIAYATNTAVMFLHRDGAHRCIFVGVTPGPEVAAYLRDVCEHAIDRAVRDFKRSDFYRKRRTLGTKRRAAHDFTRAMIVRLQNRIVEIFADTISKEMQTRALDARDERFAGAKSIDLAKTRGIRFRDAAYAGWRAGGEVGLHRGVGEAGVPKQIAGGRT